MSAKILIPAALAVSVLGLSGAASAETVYLGGPKAMMTVRTTTPTVQTNKPYAQYAPQTWTGTTDHIYVGGPKSTIPHTRR
jgi:hypothetical protein